MLYSRTCHRWQYIALRMRFACWITNATDTHPEYVTLTVFIRQNENIIQDLPPNWIISFREVYKELVHCFVVFPFYLKYLTNAEYMISSRPVASESTLMIEDPSKTSYVCSSQKHNLARLYGSWYLSDIRLKCNLHRRMPVGRSENLNNVRKPHVCGEDKKCSFVVPPRLSLNMQGLLCQRTSRNELMNVNKVTDNLCAEPPDTRCNNLIPGRVAACHWGVESGKLVYWSTFGHVPTCVSMRHRPNESFVPEQQRK